MSDWKDTVMSDKEIRDVVGEGWCAFPMQVFRDIGQTQAEISFKMGWDEGLREGLSDGVESGLREAVEWIENHGGSLDGLHNEWRAFKKQEGIE